MFQEFAFEEERIEPSQIGLKEIKQCDYVQNVFDKIEHHAVTQSIKISKLIIGYMTKRRCLQDDILHLQSITLDTKKKQKLKKKKLAKIAKEFGVILIRYLKEETSLYNIWSKNLNNTKIQLREVFPLILKELLELYKYLASFNKDVTDMIKIAYKYL